MFSKKYLLPVAFISVAAIVGCGDDSSSGPSSTEIPEKVNTLQEITTIPCNESLKDKKILVEGHDGYMQCDGKSWQYTGTGAAPVTTPASSSSDAAAPASSGEAAPASSGEAAPASSGEAAPASSGEAAPASSGEAAPASSDEAAPASSGEAAPASSGEAAPASSGEDAPAGGDMVSCDVPGAMGECIEFAAGSEQANELTEQCASVLMGTLGTGCPK